MARNTKDIVNYMFLKKSYTEQYAQRVGNLIYFIAHSDQAIALH